MTDFASLVLAVDSTQVPKGTAELEKLATAGGGAEKSARDVAAAWTKADQTMTAFAHATAEAKTEIAQANAALKAGSISQAQYEKAILGAKAAMSSVGATHRDALAEYTRLKTGMDGVTASAGAQRAGMQGLAFQLNDVISGFAMGQRPMQIFAQQGGQIAQTMAMMGVGVGGLAKAIGSMAVQFAVAHPILTAIAGAATIAAGSFKLLAVELSRDNADYLKGYAAGLKLTKEQLEEAGGAGVTFMDVIHGIGKTISDQMGDRSSKVFAALRDAVIGHFNSMAKAAQIASSAIYAGFVGGYRAIVDIWKGLPGAVGDFAVGAANGVIQALNMMLAKGTEYVNKFIGMVNPILSQIPGFGGKQIPTLGAAPQIGKIANPFAGQARALGGAVAADFAGAFDEAMSAQAGFVNKVIGNTLDAAKKRLLAARDADKARTGKSGGREAKDEISDAEKLTARLNDLTGALTRETAARKAMNDQIAAGTLTAKQAEQLMQREKALRPYMIEYAKAEGAEKKALAVAIKAYNLALKKANDEAERGKDLAGAQAIAKQITLTRQLAEAENDFNAKKIQALQGLSGEPLEQQLRLINLEYEQATEDIRAQADAADALAEGHKATAKAILDANERQKEFLAERKRWEDQSAAVAMMREQVDALGSALGNALSSLGGLGGGLGGLFGALTSKNPVAALAGMGGLGTIATVLLKPSLLTGKKGLVGQLSGGLQTLGIGSGLAGTLGTGLAGAGIGGILGKLTGSGTGGSIGGAAGMLALGPIGGIVGGLLGGLIGKLFGGDPDQAVASLSMSNGKAGFGNLGKWGKNKDQYGQEVSGAAGAVSDAINSIVSSLGGTLTDALGNISIGQFKGKWAVNDGSKAGFRGLAAGDPGATVYGSAEEAIQAAIQLAIKSATSGLSDQVKNLLTIPGSDLDAQLGKAQAFQAIVKQAADATSPLGEALKALQAQFAELDAVFAEAGATTEQFAQLTKFETDQRKALIESFGAFISENFTTDAEKLATATAKVTEEMQRLGLTGVATKAQFKAVADGIDLTTDAGVAMYEALVKIAPQFLAVADAADAAAQAEIERQANIASQRADLEIQLAEALGDKTLALAMQRQRELDAMDESLRGLQKLVWATQDHAEAVASARNVLAQAYQRERQELQQTADKMRGLADSLRAFRNSIYDSADAVSRNTALSRLMIIGAQAAAGNEGAARDLPSVTGRFLDASRNSASTLTQFRRDQALAANYVDKAIAGIDAQASAAERQIAALDKQVEGLLELNNNVVTVDQAVKDLTLLMEAPAAVMGNNRLLETQEEQVDLIDRLISEVERLNRDQSVMQAQIAEKLSRIDRFITRGETDGFKVTNDSDAPLYTSAVV